MTENTDHDDGSGVVNEDENNGVTRRDVLRGGVTLSAAIVGSNMVGRASAQTSTTTGLSGSGTEADPYLIDTASDLDAVRDDLAAHYKLTSNIDLSSIDNWQSIGGQFHDAGFTGTIEGNNHVIHGLTVNRPETDLTGLFTVIDGATITNLSLTGVTVIGAHYAGGLSGYSGYETGNTIENCVVSGTITADGSNEAGGLVGYDQDGAITGCTVNVTVESGDDGGAIVGRASNTVITDCYATGEVSAPVYTGGIAGEATGCEIRRCRFDGTVTSGRHGGGIAGHLDQSTAAECLSTGTVTDPGSADAELSLGGVAGKTPGATVSECASAVDVETTSMVGYHGGLIGDGGLGAGCDLVNSYATGSVTAAAVENYTDENTRLATGGVAGRFSGTGTSCYVAVPVVNAVSSATEALVGGAYGMTDGLVSDDISGMYWDGDVAGHDTAIGHLGESQQSYWQTRLSSGEMTGDAATGSMTTFDFDTVWVVTGSYPELAAVNAIKWDDGVPDGEFSSGTTEDPIGGGVTDSQSPARWIPWGIAGLLGLGVAASDGDGEGGGE